MSCRQSSAVVVCLCFLLCPASVAIAADFTGKVIGVLDGDTINVLHKGRAERIRLNGIDCPEKGQAYGQKAKQAASALVFGKEVTLQTYGKDKYGRTIADVLLPDGTNVNHSLVKDGWCWWYRKYALGMWFSRNWRREHALPVQSPTKPTKAMPFHAGLPSLRVLS